MGEQWNGQERWQAAGAAVERAVQAAAADIGQAGAVFFPTPNESSERCEDPTGIACLFVPMMADANSLSCMVEPDDPSHIDFLPALDFLGALSTNTDDGTPPYSAIPNGATPLLEALQHAEEVLGSPDPERGSAVVVITDGEPNCKWDAAVANRIVTGWRDQGIITHVIRLPGIVNAPPSASDGATALNQLAQSGGTDQSVTPPDADSLEDTLLEILANAGE